MHSIFIITGLIFAAGLAGFAVTSFFEREIRAGLMGSAFTAAFAGAWFGVGMAFPGGTTAFAILAWAAAIAGFVALSRRVGPSDSLEIDASKTERYDERHTIFGRMELEEGLPQYREYYEKLNPGMKGFDDRLRAMPDLGEPGGVYAHPLDSPYLKAVFSYIKGFHHLANPGDPGSERAELSPEEATRRVKGFARHLGALDVRITRLKDHHVYTHAGRMRRPDLWGSALEPEHTYAIVFSVEMDHGMVRVAPMTPAAVEASIQYMKVANIGISVAAYISLIGWRARAHIDGNYHVLNTALAHEAGIGELGRLGLIITPTHGPRVRLAVVTTDLPLVEDGPVNLGVQHFCQFCKKCAANCPSGSIASGDKKEVRGVVKWQSNMESCFQYWKKVGTDCALCIAVCPYSKPNTFYHKIVRFLSSRNAHARKLALFMDDVFYSRTPRHKRTADWFSNDSP